jgi:hypothetical protein
MPSSAPQFQLRRLKDGRYKLSWLNPFETPGAMTLLSAGLREWAAAQKTIVMRDGNECGGTIESRPKSITLGYYTADGFSPLPRWQGAMLSELVQDRILRDLEKLRKIQ